MTSPLNLQECLGDVNIYSEYKKHCRKNMRKKEVIRISKRRTATLRKDGRYQVYIKEDDGK